MGSPALARAAAVCVLFTLLLAANAAAATHSFAGKQRSGGMYAFSVAKLRGTQVTKAVLVRGKRRQRLSVRVVARAAGTGDGKLRVRPKGALRRCRVLRCRMTLRVLTRSATDSGSRPAEPAPAPATARPPLSTACGFGNFDVGNWPGACWRPYSDASPFNRRLPDNPPLASNSLRVVARLASWGRPHDKLQTRGGESATDYEHPYYFSRAGDPEFTINCVAYGGNCPIDEVKLRIPDAARAANGPDRHMAVIDQATGWEYDFFSVESKPRGGGRLDIKWGARTRIGTPDALGLGGGGTASGFGLMAGMIRGPEVEALEIPHALFMVARCQRDEVVYPADGKGWLCSERGEPNADAPAMGQHFFLDMSDAEIEALGGPPLQKAVLRAMAHYGMFMGDTGGDPWNILFESDATYESFGATPQVRAAFRAQGSRHYEDGVYNSENIDTLPIDWAHRLRVVDPCFAAGTC